MSSRQFDPDSLRPGVATAGQPPVPASALPEDAYEVEVLRTVADGTRMLTSSRALGRYPAEIQSLSFPDSGAPVLTLSPRDAAMLGLYRLIDQLRWQSYDFEALAGGDSTVRVNSHRLKRVFLDWPDEQKESMPTGSALITSPERASYETPTGFRARLLPETLDRFAPRTLLRYLGEVQVPIMLIMWCAHKDHRRGLEAKIGQVLAAERHTDDAGRRIIIPEYFSRVARYTLADTERPDSAGGARGHEWIVSCTINVEIPQVELVRSPGLVEGTEIAVEADPGTTPAPV